MLCIFRQWYPFLQEVDRLEKIGPALETAGYSYVFTSGPKKKHGCLVAFKRASYKLAAQKTIFYDDTEVHPSSTEGELLNLNISQVGRKGSSFRTKNIGLIVALKRVTRINNDIIENQNTKGSEEQDSNKIRVGDNDTNGNENDDKNKDINNKNNDDDNGELGKKTGAVDEGFDKEDSSVVVATTHLFWHPRYTYERARQSLILVRSVCEFKKDNNISDAPSFIAGGKYYISFINKVYSPFSIGTMVSTFILSFTSNGSYNDTSDYQTGCTISDIKTYI